MSAPSLPDHELALLVDQVEEQLATLRAAPPDAAALRTIEVSKGRHVPAAPAQQAVIERATGG